MNRAVPLILAFALFMEQMDSTVISTALPAIAAEIDTSPIALKLALTAYLVSVAIFIPLSGWLADRFSAKPVFSAAILVFIGGSVACAAADSLSGFVFARFFQGMGGAMMTPISRLILVRGTDKSKLIDALAWLTIPALAGPVIGPPLGGFITTYFSWHWIFLINVPIGFAGILATVRLLPDTPSQPPGELDAVGLLLAGLAASGLIFGLSVISLPALPATYGVAAVAIGFVSAAAYIFHSRRIANPAIRLGLLANPVYRATVLSGSLFRIGNGALPFILPLMLQLGFGLTPFQSGSITFITALGAISMKFSVQRVIAGFGFKRVLMAAALVTAILIAMCALISKMTPLGFLYALLFVIGFSRSLFFTGLNALSFAEIDPRDISHATVLNATTQQLSVAAGVAMAGIVLESLTDIGSGGVSQTGFRIVFLIVGATTALAALPIARLQAAAGAGVSGHYGGDAPKPPLP